MLITSVITSRIRPASISAETSSGPAFSKKSLAISLAIVEPWENRDFGM